MKKFLHHVLRRNAYFLLGAAWLFSLAFIIHNYWATFNSERYLKNSIEHYIQRQERDFESLTRQKVLLQKLAKRNYTLRELNRIINKPYGVFLYEPDVYGLINLKFWNTQYALPTAEILSGKKPNGFISLSSGQYEYIYRHIDLGNNRKMVVIALVPIYKQYFIQNTSLRKEFVDHSQAEDRITISQKPGKYMVKSSYGDTLFYLHPKPLYRESNTNWFSLALT